MPLIKQDSDTSSNISLDSLICVTNLQNEEEEGKSSDILSKVPTVQLEYKHEILEITSILYHLSNKNLIHGARNRNSSTVKRVKLNKGKLLRAYHKSKEILKNTTQNCYSFNRCLFDYLMTKSFQSVHRAASLDDQQFELQYDRVLERFYKIHKRQEATDKEVSTSLEVVFKIKASAKESLENVENDMVNHFKDRARTLEGSLTGTVNEQVIQQQITRLLKSQEKRSTDRVKWTKFQRIYLETKEQDEDMDKLGEGFKTCNIVHLQGNNNLLASKIEIKNEEIRKFNLEQLSKTNQSANLREKHFTVLEGTLREQRDSLYEIRMLENIVKSYLTRATNFKEELLQKLENLIGNTGLLHHSVLLRDFESLVQVMSETSEKMSQIVLECSNTTKKTNQMKETMLKMKKSQSH